MATDEARGHFLDKLAGIRYDAALITGDISTSRHLTRHLAEISRACGPRPVYFILGNHDYFDGSFAAVDRAVEELCSRCRNLIALGHGEIIGLNHNTALVGTRGWYDGRAGAGASTWVDSPDRHLIDDFRGISKSEFFARLSGLGAESAHYFRRILPLALTAYRNVIVATHVPPFTQALRHGGSHCDWYRQPYFSNRSAGNVLMGIAKQFNHRRIMVHSGHTHSPAHSRMRSNLEIRVGGAQPGRPALQDILTID